MTSPSQRRGEAVLRPARAALRPAGRAVRRPARALADVLRYWHAERTTLRQGMASLSISALGSIPTGLTLGAMTGRLEELPGLFILIPAAIGMRGAIFGALASRLGTALHAGILRLQMGRGSLLAENVIAATLQTLTSSVFLAGLARVVTAATGLPSVSIWDFLAISVLAGVASSAVVLVVTVWLAAQASLRDWDLDSVAAPIITFVGDLITLPTLFAASYVAGRGAPTLALGAASAAAGAVAIAVSVRLRLPRARRIIAESAITLAAAGLIDLFAGTIVEHRAQRFLAFPALLVLLPPFLENAGALGGIVSSRLASRLHLGAIRPRLLPERLAALDVSLAGPWALLNFALLGAGADLVARALGFASPGLPTMVWIALVAGAMATAGAAIVAYATAVATFRFELDPDNHGIAAVTSSMDLVGVVCVVATVSLLGVG